MCLRTWSKQWQSLGIKVYSLTVNIIVIKIQGICHGTEEHSHTHTHTKLVDRSQH